MGTTRGDFDDRYAVLAATAYRVAYRVLGDRGDAEEVTQEALVRAYVRWRSVADHDEPWVARVAMNLALDRWRRRSRSSLLADVPSARTEPGAEEAAVLRLGLAHALQSLPRRQREVVGLRYLADLSERQVADVLRTTVGSVKQHAHRALARLRLEPSLGPMTEVDDVL
jgi:RNA polymerase sigma-70 factor (sigma-E family)